MFFDYQLAEMTAESVHSGGSPTTTTRDSITTGLSTPLVSSVHSEGIPTTTTGDSTTTGLSTPLVSFVPLGRKEFIPFCNDVEKIPKEKQTFETLDAGITFYRNYAKLCGFSCRKSSTKRTRDGTLRLKNVLCSSVGLREDRKMIPNIHVAAEVIEEDGTNSEETAQNSSTETEATALSSGTSKPRERVRMITRFACKAMIQFTLQEDGNWIVNKFVEGHTHPLASPESMMFLKENRELTSIQKNFIVKTARLKMGGRKAFRGWKEFCGGYRYVGATEDDFKNFVRDMQQYIGNYDGQMIIENFMRIKGTCRAFYFDFHVDDNAQLDRLMWVDAVMMKNYMLFGDMAAVDSTFHTNKYDMVFVPFTGVDHHKSCITFGVGLLAKEDKESYTWLFESFLEAMGDCQPKIIITDQCPSMKEAIDQVFTTSTHRLCMWHIMKKLHEKVDAYLWQDPDFKKTINACVWNNCLDPDDFEREWDDVMEKFDLVDHPWFSHLFLIKKQWIPAYFKDHFMGGLMRVTSRSESQNSFFDRFGNTHATLVEFWMCFESAMDAQRHKQSKLNTQNKHSNPPLKTPWQLEKHASEIYTHNIFKEYQVEISSALYNCGMEDMGKKGETDVYIITDSEKNAKTWEVNYSPTTGDITCSCSLFQRMGILCRHALWVLKTKRVQTIPEQYIVDWWTKKAMSKPMFDRHGNLLQDCKTSEKRLTAELWEEVYSCVSLAEETEEDMQYLIEKLKEIKIEMKSKKSTTNKSKDKKKELEHFVGFKIPETVTIRPPKKSNNKGSRKRIKSKVMEALEQSAKKQRLCKKCGGTGHDSRNCTSNIK